MTELNTVIHDIGRCICHVPYACKDCSHGKEDRPIDCMENLLRDALELLKEQNKTGKWEEKIDYMGDTYYDCSACGESWTTIDGTPWQNGMNYCPHCGVKMELVK